MSTKGYVIFFLVFVVVFNLIEILLFDRQMSLTSVGISVLAGLLALTLLYLYERWRKSRKGRLESQD